MTVPMVVDEYSSCTPAKTALYFLVHVNPGGLETDVTVEIGTSSGIYTLFSDTLIVPAGTTTVIAAPTGTGLTEGTIYFWRANAINDDGEVNGPEHSCTTLTNETSFTYEKHLVCEPWVTIQDVKNCCSKINCEDPEDPISDEEIQEAIDVASEILYYATALQFPGFCTEDLRPCVESACGCWSDWYGTTLYSPSELGRGCNGCSCCDNYKRLNLGLWPIHSVINVDIEGDTISPALYHVEDNRFLVWTPQPPDYDRPSWPACQERDRPTGAPNTFTVTVQYGLRPPPAGKRAARVLACEYIALCRGQNCALPPGVRGITKQGVSIDMTDPSELRQLGLFGIPAVDFFLTTYNPKKIQSAAFAWSPDSRPNIRQWT